MEDVGQAVTGKFRVPLFPGGRVVEPEETVVNLVQDVDYFLPRITFAIPGLVNLGLYVNPLSYHSVVERIDRT